MARVGWVSVALITLIGLTSEAQTIRYIDGIFIAPRGGAPLELIAYAESLSTGVLRMQHGTVEDAPLVHEIVSILASLPNWRPQSITVSTEKIFQDDRAERRGLVFSVNKLNVYALGLRVVDLERRDKIESLLKSVKASAVNPGYAFVGMQADGYVRYYPMRLTPLEK